MENFVRLLLSNERDLYGYTYSLLPHAEDAREAVQEAAITMWQHFDEFDPSRAFFPWASRFAYFSVLNFRKKKARANRLLTEAAMMALAQEYQVRPEDADEKLARLPECLKKLPPDARKLLEQRYRHGETVQDIAQKTGRSVHTLYKTFERMRHWLMECISKGLVVEDRP